MCYEFSEWARRIRAADQARKEEQRREQASKQPKPAPQAQPATPEPYVGEREKVPA
jgi:hypothetical protein